MISLLRTAKILVNTSTAEGFPNTFLEAGLTQTPILSLKVNPDNFISKYKCGVIASNNQKDLEKRLSNLLNHNSRLRKLGVNNYKYAIKYHGLKNLKVLKQALLDLC